MGLAEQLQCQQITEHKSQGQHLNQESFGRYRLSGNFDMLFKRLETPNWKKEPNVFFSAF